MTPSPAAPAGESDAGAASPLRRAVASAFSWNLASMVIGQLAMVGIFLFLTSRLEPATFGVFGLAAAIIDLIVIQGTTAAADAVVRHRDHSRSHQSTVFWSLAGFSFLAMLVLVALSDPLANAMGEPEVGPVLAALSLTLLFIPATVGPTAMMREAMDFKGLALRQIVGTLAGGAIALVVAFSSMAEWALVVQRWISMGLAAALLIAHTRFRVDFVCQSRAALEFFTASGRLFLAQGLLGLFPRFLDMVIGVQFGAAVLGSFRVASRISEMVLVALLNPFGQLWLVLFSRAAAADRDFRSVFLKLSPLMALIAAPAFAGLALVAGDLVDFLLAPDYAPVGIMLAIVSGINVLAPLNNPRNSVLTALGRFNLLVVIAVLETVIGIAAVLFALQFGVAAALLATAAPVLACIFFFMPMALRSCNVSPVELLLAVWRPYAGVALMTAVVLALRPALQGEPPLERLVVSIVAGAVVYVGFLCGTSLKWTLSVIRMRQAA